MTPKETLHAHCHYCVQSRMDEAIQDCTGSLVYATGKPCPFYPCRLSTGRVSVKVLRRLCLDECMGGAHEFVASCEDAECLLYSYRLGRNPARIGRGHKKGAEALRMYRERGDRKGFGGQIPTITPRDDRRYVQTKEGQNISLTVPVKICPWVKRYLCDGRYGDK